VFTARYALSAYIKQTRFVFKGLNIGAEVELSLKHWIRRFLLESIQATCAVPVWSCSYACGTFLALDRTLPLGVTSEGSGQVRLGDSRAFSRALFASVADAVVIVPKTSGSVDPIKAVQIKRYRLGAAWLSCYGDETASWKPRNRVLKLSIPCVF
jgi:hypothetical protein